MEHGQLISEALDILTGENRDDVIDFEAVLAVEFEEFFPLDRAYLDALVGDGDLVCIAEENASVRRTWVEMGYNWCLSGSETRYSGLIHVRPPLAGKKAGRRNISGTNTKPLAMHQDEIEISLRSTEPAGDYNPEVQLRISAHFREDATSNGNTLYFNCDPVGTNYRSSYLKVTFDDWSKVIGIRDFLAECFADDVTTSRTLSVEVEDGVASITPFNKPPNEQKGLDEITIQMDGNRIEFYCSGSLYPYIFTYEEKIDGEPQDRNNAKKLLNFFDEIISLHPDFDPTGEDSESPEVGPLFNQHRVESLLSELVSTDDDLYKDYQKAVREFEGGEYADSIRDLGRAAEILIGVIARDVYDEENLPDNVAGKINKLDKSTDGLPSFISKTISPLWWLRNRVAHAGTYDATEEDALYALLCFQMAVEKLIDEHIDN